MRLQKTPSLLLAAAIAGTVHAYQDSSPFFLLSTEKSSKTPTLGSSQITSASRLEEQLIESLGNCNAQLYVVVPHLTLRASDIRNMDLSKTVTSRYRTVVDIPEVLGDLDITEAASRLRHKCELDLTTLEEYFSEKSSVSSRTPSIIVTSSESNANGGTAIQRSETTLTNLLSLLSDHPSHTLIVASSSVDTTDTQEYDMDADSEAAYQNILHTDLKRDVHSPLVRRQGNRTSPADPQAGLPLFERYQFLTPGIFMGLSVSILLFVILYVGVTAIAGLEVSYAAFSKENGPQGQGKGKQQ